MNNKIFLYLHFIFLNIISFGWICAIPIMVEHLNSTLGNNSYFFQFVLISTIIGLVFNLFFGRLLDKKDSRIVLFIGLTFNLLFWILLSLFENYYLILLAFVFEGISFSALLISRAPYFYDLISKIKNKEYYEKIEANSKIGMIALTIFLFLLSGYLYSINENIPFIINSIFVLFTFFMVLSYINIDLKVKKEITEIKPSLLNDLKTIFYNNKQLFYLTFSEGFFAALTPYLFFFLNVHLISNGADVLFISYLASIMYFFRIIGAFLIKKFNNVKLLMISFIILITLMILISKFNIVYIISGLFLLSSIFKEYIEIYLITEVTKQSPENLKGTVRSFSEIISNIGIIFLMIFTTFFVDLFSSNFLMLFYSGLFTLCFYFLYKYKHYYKLNSTF